MTTNSSLIRSRNCGLNSRGERICRVAQLQNLVIRDSARPNPKIGLRLILVKLLPQRHTGFLKNFVNVTGMWHQCADVAVYCTTMDLKQRGETFRVIAFPETVQR